LIRLASGTTQQFGSSVAVPATGDSRSISTNVCFNIIDSAFPAFADTCSVLPQTTFSLPNFLSHKTKQEANDLLLALTPVFNSQCFSHMRMFTCPLFFPPCDGEPILPCAKFCRGKKYLF
jgi:Fz domain